MSATIATAASGGYSNMLATEYTEGEEYTEKRGYAGLQATLG